MAKSLRGHFLIANRRMRDRNFFKTVVLIAEHGKNGAMGIVLNRPSSITIANALAGHFQLPEDTDCVYFGGPVEEQALFILHDQTGLEEQDAPVVPGVYVASSPVAFSDVMQRVEKGDPSIRYRVFSGCSGWSRGQLEQEISRNDWHVVAAPEKLIFSDCPYSLWEDAMQHFRSTHAIVPGIADQSGDLN